MKLIVGIISYIVPEGFFFETEDGELHELKGLDLDRGLEMPLNGKVALMVDEDWNVSDAEDFYYPMEAPADVRTVEHKRIGVFARNGGESMAKSNALSVKKFWGQVSEGYWKVETFGCGMKEEFANCYPFPQAYCKQQMHTTWDEIPEEERPFSRPNYWHLMGGYKQNMCGQATLGGRYGVTYSDGGCAGTTLWHELGHNFGLMHSNLYEDGVVKEYKDSTSTMASHSAAGLNIVNIHHLGFHEEDDVRTIDSNKMFVVCPWETPREVRMENEKPINIITAIGGDAPRRHKYYVSIRKDKGYPHKTVQPGTLFIHRGASDSVLLEKINPGESSTMIPGVTITNIKYENEACLVVAEYDNDNSAPEVDDIMPFEFPTRPVQTELSEVHNGAWYNPKMVGQGFDLYVKDGRMSIFWYTFQEGSSFSQRDWYIGAQDLTPGPEVFDLVTIEGASFSNPPSGDPVVVGQGQIYFFDETNGVFNFNTETHGRGSIPITAIVRSNGPQDGAYYEPARNQEGFTFRFLEDGDRCVGYWYTYGPTSIIVKQPPRTWMLLDGRKQDDGSYLLDALSVSGEFIAYTDSEDLRSKVIGQTKLTPNDDGTFTFEADLKNYRLRSKLQKLF